MASGKASTGAHDVQHLLTVRDQSIVAFGTDRLAADLQADLDVYNARTQELISSFCEISTDRRRRYGSAVDGEMVEVNEYGRAPTQRARTGDSVEFPLRRYDFALGWTRDYTQLNTPADMAASQIAAQKAHQRQIQRTIKQALFLPANYTTRDWLIDEVELGVKRLLNADGAAIPSGPHGELFNGATHTHYNAVDGLTKAAATALVKDVVEHGHGGNVKIAINSGDEEAWRALEGFKEYADPRLVYREGNTPGMTLDITTLDNRAIGIFSSAEVMTRSWVPAGYAFAWDANSEKPVLFRQRDSTTLQGLRILATLETFPLYAEYMRAEFGAGVWNRTNGAVLYFGGATYTAPALN